MLPTYCTVNVRSSRQMEETYSYEDDWTGRASAKERKRLQNRLHQRAWRRRKAAEKGDYIARGQSARGRGCEDRNPEDPYLALAFARATAALISQETLPKQVARSSAVDVPGIDPKSPKRLESVSTTVSPCSNGVEPTAKRYPPPTSGLHFPLSLDHRLITLIQYNVIRALLTNIFLASNIQEVPSECLSSLSFILPGPSALPPTFSPTHLQLSIDHPYWIDSVPCPQLRDNLIMAVATEDERFDEDKMCGDMCGGFYDGFDDCELRGILVWGEPWDLWSWELTEGFVKRWDWLLRGCMEMVRASNLWREGRGEEPLVVEIE